MALKSKIWFGENKKRGTSSRGASTLIREFMNYYLCFLFICPL